MKSFSLARLAPIEGPQALSEAIRTVLFTPVGSRVGRRDFGSLLPELVDHPENAATTVLLYGATALALLRWLPQFRLARTSIEHLSPGQARLRVEGRDRTAPDPNALLAFAFPIRLPAGAGAAIPQPA
ncbi:GPW/gp25 family protein [Phenylobacterium sp.]|uniref:GPW/gp25 family protein n=1 Tax=Phenylobacterium sp. TaxID=1871053 RepID=UPI00301BD555